MRFISTVAATLTLFAATALGQGNNGEGLILEPTPYTKVAPGGLFNFSYDTRADYCRSSYAHTVYLFTELPKSLGSLDVIARGHFFGRYDAANYPGKQTRNHGTAGNRLLTAPCSGALPTAPCAGQPHDARLFQAHGRLGRR